jgi:hypothetical protein
VFDWSYLLYPNAPSFDCKLLFVKTGRHLIPVTWVNEFKFFPRFVVKGCVDARRYFRFERFGRDYGLQEHW